MGVKLAWNEIKQFTDAVGVPYIGAKVFFYTAGSSAKQTTYTDSAGLVPNTNPVILDSAGRCTQPVWLTTGVAYKIILAPANDVDPPTSPIWTLDQVTGLNDSTSVVSEWSATLAATFVSATQFTLVGDQTTNFHVGRRIKATVAAGTSFGTIITSAYTASTAITLAMDTGQTLDSGLSVVSFSILSAANPSLPNRGVISPAQFTVNQNNLALTNFANATVVRFSTNARLNITGLAGGSDGKTVVFHNVGTFPGVFTFQDTLSTAANRFAFGVTLGGGQSMTLVYDATSALWRASSLPPGPVGQIIPFAGGTVPAGTLARDGSNISRTTYAALFNEVGTPWGVGDGSTTFGVGDDRRRAWVGSGGTGTATLANTVGSTGGEEGHVLIIAETPSHSHTIPHGNGGIDDSTTGRYGVNSAGQTTFTSNVTGGGGAHNVIQPSAVITSVIRYC